MEIESATTMAQIAAMSRFLEFQNKVCLTYSLTTANNGRMMTTMDMVIMTPTKNLETSVGGFKDSHIEIV